MNYTQEEIANLVQEAKASDEDRMEVLDQALNALDWYMKLYGDPSDQTRYGRMAGIECYKAIQAIEKFKLIRAGFDSGRVINDGGL